MAKRLAARDDGQMDADDNATRSSLDARAGSGPPPLGALGASSRLRGVPRHSLLWWVFLANGAVLVVATVLLAITPIEISAPIALEQLMFLLGGLVAMLALDLILLRRVLAPFVRLTEVMSSVDPDRPGRRLTGIEPRSSEGAALAGAFNTMLERLEIARREAAGTALAAQERERLRVARELHDEVGQTLTAVTLKAERAAGTTTADSAADFRAIADDIRTSLDDVRRIARELRPEALDDLGLVNALIALCSRVGEQTETRIERELEAGLPPLDPDVELVVYRVAQEALTNVVRHARATRASVSLRAEDGGVVLRVRDDGRGLPAELPKGTAGLGGMRERALLVGGRLTIRSDPDRGTEVTLEVSGAGADA